jgi:hypothetical protein
VKPGGGSGQLIGNVSGVVPLIIHDPSNTFGTVNTVDLAWCNPSVQVHETIGSKNLVPAGKVNWIRQFQRNSGQPIKVQVYGKESKGAHGQIRAIRVFFYMTHPTVSGKLLLFENIFELEIDIIQHGDSGALVLSEPGLEIGAVLFAKDQTFSNRGFAYPWKVMREESSITFRYPVKS